MWRKAAVTAGILILAAVMPITVEAANNTVKDAVISDKNIIGIVEKYVKNGWLKSEEAKQQKLLEPVSRFEFAKLLLSICEPEILKEYNINDLKSQNTKLYNFAFTRGYINDEPWQNEMTCKEAAMLANKVFGTQNSMELFDISKVEETAEYQINERPLLWQEAIIFSEKLRTLPIKLNIADQGYAKVISFNKGKGYLNGKQIGSDTSVYAIGVYFVTVMDKFGNKVSGNFIKLPQAVTNPLEAYTPARCAEEIEALSSQYPGLIKTGSIGKSTEGMDIPYITIGKGNKKILFVGSVHAREHITTAYLMHMADKYAMAYYGNQSIRGYDVSKVLNSTTITIVPMLNPDGVSFVVEGYKNISRENIENRFGKVPEDVRASWKETATGTNLNRNFPFYWDGNIAASRGFLNAIAGDFAASEPETRALMNFCRSQRFEFALACHAKGEVLFWRDSKNGTVKGDELLAKTISNSTGYKMEKVTTDPSLYGGGFENWFRYEFKKPAVCIEFTPHDYKETPHDNSDFYRLIWNKADSMGLAVSQIK